MKPTQTGNEIRCFGRVDSSHSTFMVDHIRLTKFYLNAITDYTKIYMSCPIFDFFLHSYFCTLYFDTQNTLHSSYIEYSVVWNITKCITLYCYFIQIYLKYPCFQQIDTATLKSQMADFFKAALDYDVYRYNIKFF